MVFGTLLDLAVNTTNGAINGLKYTAEMGMQAAAVVAPAAKKIGEATLDMAIKPAVTGLKYTAEATISAAAPTAKRIGEATVEFASKPEVQSAACKTLKAAAGAGVAIGVATLALPAAGFTAAGVAKGSLAASAHSAIGNVAAGSTFAACQSAGVVGTAVTTKLSIGSIGAYFGSKLKGN